MRGVLASVLAAGLAVAVVGTAILASAASLLGLGSGAQAPSSAATANIPANILALYEQAAATCPGVPWTILAAIGTIESTTASRPAGSHSGANSAGAVGIMQFEPATFSMGKTTRPTLTCGLRNRPAASTLAVGNGDAVMDAPFAGRWARRGRMALAFKAELRRTPATGLVRPSAHGHHGR